MLRVILPNEGLKSEDKWFSSSYRTLGSTYPLKRNQHLNILEAISSKYLPAPRLGDCSDQHLLRLIYVLTGKAPKTKLVEFVTRTKRAFRMQFRTQYDLKFSWLLEIHQP